MKLRSAGYTLIELAAALTILGLIMVMVWRFGSLAIERIVETETPAVLAAADQAIIGFVMAKHRLPCPDTTGDGNEHCGGAAVGRLPVVALGLARTDMQSLRYGVYRSGTVHLDTAVDRFQPLVTSVAITPGAANSTGYDFASASASATALGNVNGIDFCDALRTAGTTSANSAALNVTNDQGNLIKNVAYALALPGAKDMDGDGSMFDGANTGALTFSAPSRPVSSIYDDFVLSNDFGQVFDRLSCGGILSAADHAHFNAESAAALIYADFVNYYGQLQIAVDLAEANYLLAVAAAVQASGDVSATAANILFDTAEALVTGGATTPILVQGAIDAVVAAAALVTAGVAAGEANDNWSGAKETRDAFQPFLDESQLLSQAILLDAMAADAAGLY